MNARHWTVATLVFFGGIGSALAQDSTQPAPDVCPPGTVPEETPACPPPPAPPPPAAKAPRRKLFAPNQVALSVGGGVGAFNAGRIRGPSTAIGAWDVRLLVGARSPIAFEGGYLGTAGAAEDPFDPVTLSSTQIFGGARLQLPWVVQPFINVGAGWIKLKRGGNAVSSPVAAATFSPEENGVVVPMGGGVAVYPLRHGMVEARADYRLVAGAKDFTNTNQRPDMWLAQLRAGYAF